MCSITACCKSDWCAQQSTITTQTNNVSHSSLFRKTQLTHGVQILPNHCSMSEPTPFHPTTHHLLIADLVCVMHSIVFCVCRANQEPQPVSLSHDLDLSQPLKQTPSKPKAVKAPRVAPKSAANVEDEEFFKTLTHAGARNVNLADFVLDRCCRVSIHICRSVMLCCVCDVHVVFVNPQLFFACNAGFSC